LPSQTTSSSPLLSPSKRRAEAIGGSPSPSKYVKLDRASQNKGKDKARDDSEEFSFTDLEDNESEDVNKNEGDNKNRFVPSLAVERSTRCRTASKF
jgi:hypothetical protein